MKYLILSDLHISVDSVTSQFKLEKYKRILKNNLPESYDIVLISGDVFEHRVPHYVNVFETLQYFFDFKPAVFCLGNHEFAYEDHDSVLKTYKAQYEVFKSKWPNGSVCCLDISGYYDFDNARIVGNVFWYDWSLNHCRTLMKGEIVDGWLDATIENFDAMKEHENCKKQIMNSLSEEKNHILLTHTVPYEKLNMFSIEEPNSPYNSYSGCADFLNEIKDKNFKFAFCGHTHKKANLEVYDINCLNIGNDYYFKTFRIDWALFDMDKDLNIFNILFSKQFTF